jgi:hypothetical protein
MIANVTSEQPLSVSSPGITINDLTVDQNGSVVI